MLQRFNLISFHFFCLIAFAAEPNVLFLDNGHGASSEVTVPEPEQSQTDLPEAPATKFVDIDNPDNDDSDRYDSDRDDLFVSSPNSPQMQAFIPSTLADCHRDFRGQVETCGHRARETWAGDGPCVNSNRAAQGVAGGLIATILGTATNNGTVVLAGARAFAEALPDLFRDDPRCLRCLDNAQRSFERCLNIVFPPGRLNSVCGTFIPSTTSRGPGNSNYYEPAFVRVTNRCQSQLRCCSWFFSTAYCFFPSQTEGRTCAP